MTETQHQQRPEANDVLMGGGGFPSAKFDQLRVWVGGTIVAKPTTRQETEYKTGVPKTYPKSGDPIYGLVVDVQTDQRTDNDDDGVRRIYVEGKRMKDAVRDAVIASGAPGLETRGQLFVAWIGEEQGQGATPAKVYEARYYPPATAVPSASNGSTGAAAPMADPRTGQGGLNVFGQPATPAPTFAEPAPVAAPVPAAPMPEPGAQSPVQGSTSVQNPAPQGQMPSPHAQPDQSRTSVPSSDPTPEAIAALRAAGLDPQAVFPNYRG